MGDIIKEPEVLITDPTTGVNAPVSSTTPAGTEDGLYVRVVSAAASQIQVRKSSGVSTDVGFRPQDSPIPFAPAETYKDALGRARVSIPEPIFDAHQIYDNGLYLFTTSTTGGGTATYDTNEAATLMTVGTASGDKVIRQTRRYLSYRPGQSQLICITGVMGALKTNLRQRIGYFDDNDGLFFEQDGNSLKVVRRTSVSGTPVDNTIAQSSWNLDRLDGSGGVNNPSGVALDTSKAQLFVIDYSWLGTGRVRFGIFLNGSFLYCHEIHNGNSLNSVYMRTPSLPVRWELENTGTTASSSTMKQICCAGLSEGSQEGISYIASANTGTTAIAVTTTAVPLIGIRLKSTHSRATLFPRLVQVLTASNRNLLCEIWLRATITGGTWVASSPSAEINITGTGFSTTNALRIGSFYVSSRDRETTFDVSSKLGLNSSIAGVSDQLVVTAVTLGGYANAYASVEWREVV